MREAINIYKVEDYFKKYDSMKIPRAWGVFQKLKLNHIRPVCANVTIALDDDTFSLRLTTEGFRLTPEDGTS